MIRYIKEARPTDVSDLSNLIRKAYRNVADRFQLTPANCPKHPSNCTDDWIEKDLERGVRYFIMMRADTPVGCVAIEIAKGDLCYLERLAVLPQERNKGFGRQLVEHVFRTAREEKAKKISIGIIAKQADLKQWYQNIGFIEGETKEFNHLPFQVCFLTYEL
jgi:N-acetylglutamate synthase-like GNAT family acetyltransferase